MISMPSSARMRAAYVAASSTDAWIANGLLAGSSGYIHIGIGQSSVVRSCWIHQNAADRDFGPCERDTYHLVDLRGLEGRA